MLWLIVYHEPRWSANEDPQLPMIAILEVDADCSEDDVKDRAGALVYPGDRENYPSFSDEEFETHVADQRASKRCGLTVSPVGEHARFVSL